MASRNDLTPERLRALLRYEPDTGRFIWIYNRMHPNLIGTVAGCPHPSTLHITIYCDAKPYKAHRLAWLYMTGEWPSADIDHRNRIANDNRWDNLRLATKSGNQCNKTITALNTSGYKGVDYVKREHKWRARIVISGKSHCLGYFHSAIEAAKAYDDHCIISHGEFACPNFPDA